MELIPEDGLSSRGDDASATDLCLELWDEKYAHRDEHLDLLSLVHVQLPTLFSRFARAREAFVERRDALTERIDEPLLYLRWMQLNGALNDGDTVLRWLEAAEPESLAIRRVWMDERIHRFVEHAGAWSTLARHLDIDEVESQLREELEPLAEMGIAELFDPSVASFAVPQRAMKEVGRSEDAARITAIVENLRPR